MAINLKALRDRLTPVTEAQAQEIMTTGMTKHAQRYGLPSHDAIGVEKTEAARDTADGIEELAGRRP